MAYHKKKYVSGTTPPIQNSNFVDEFEEMYFTSLPVAVSSWVLESIGFREMVNSIVDWDPVQCEVSPGDAAKAMILTMSMGPERPAIENVADRFENEPVNLYFTTVKNRHNLDPDMLARQLTRIHEANEDKLFMNTSAALRTHFGIQSKVVHSDTTSVSVYGEYDRYSENGKYASLCSSNGTRIMEEGALYITRGFSKDHRPELKQYMLGDVVDDNGIPWVSHVMNGNTGDPMWNKRCLEMLGSVLTSQEILYVADSKVVNDPLVTKMIEDGVYFLSRCPVNFNCGLLQRTLMSFDLNRLMPIENISPRKGAATRRICGTTVDYKGHTLRAVLVETSTLMGKGEKAISNEEKKFVESLGNINKEFSCLPDAEKAFAKFMKKHSDSIFDISVEYENKLVEKRPKGRPKKDGSDIRRYDVWTMNISYKINPEKAEALRRRKGYIMLISNMPTPDESPSGMTDEQLVKAYSNEWHVEWSFRGKKRPVLVERLFMKDPGRAAALITMVNIAAMIRAVVQLLLRRGIDQLDDSELPFVGSCGSRLKRNASYDYFMERCMRCLIRYDPIVGRCRFFNNDTDKKSSAYLSIMGINKDKLFSGGC